MKKILCLLLVSLCSCELVKKDDSRCYSCTTWNNNAATGALYPDIKKDVCSTKKMEQYTKDMTGTKNGIAYRTICTEKK